LKFKAHLQNNQSKMDWRCGSSGECLLCKHEALSSNPSLNKQAQERGSREFSGSEPPLGDTIMVEEWCPTFG
jgi:hypothetical protein